MIQKKLIYPERLRRLPAHWSWVDHRLVRDNYLERCGSDAWSLYLFLVSVGDAQGLSYYSQAAICRIFTMEGARLSAARTQLCRAGLVAYAKPLYQVLELGSPSSALPNRTEGETMSLGQLLRRAVEEGGQR
ncbi:MAG TPA: hypothetical protein EYQ50_21335 [Verrucomicrobiales bacterium]|jgi:hypothetical protein|nr:hypothetical protein [Verrucomicrobiales bacterium]